MVDTADLSLHELYNEMVAAYLDQKRAAAQGNTEAEELSTAEATDLAVAILERDYTATGAILYRIFAFFVLSQNFPGEGGISHAQEAVRLVDEDMRAQGCPQYIFDEVLAISETILRRLKRKLELEERMRVLQAGADLTMKKLEELEVQHLKVKQTQEAKKTQEAGGDKTM